MLASRAHHAIELREDMARLREDELAACRLPFLQQISQRANERDFLVGARFLLPDKYPLPLPINISPLQADNLPVPRVRCH